MGSYVGTELELFARATNWKRYVCRQAAPFVRGAVAEVGAGIGATSRAICNSSVTSWTCVEPDVRMAEQLAESLRERPLAGGLPSRVVAGTLRDLPSGELYDAVLYVDVLEHIADDAQELTLAAGRLKPGGGLVVVSPAHQWLFSPFDRQIGHHRRYRRATLRALDPPGAALVLLRYLDSFGLLASLGNRLLLRSGMPTPGQLAFWDRALVPASRLFDPILGYRVGKTILGVWRQRERG